MPYGVSAQVWQYLPEDDKAQIIKEYNASQSPTAEPADTYDDFGYPVPVTYDEFGMPSNATSEQIQQAQGQYENWLNALAMGGAVGHGPVEGGYGSGTGGFLQEYSGPPAPVKTTFSDANLSIVGAPSWWKGLKPDQLNPISEYQTLSNLLIPLLSPEDQMTVATNLYQSDPEAFAHLNPEELTRTAPPVEITPEIRQRFFTGERAQQALDAFDQLLTLSNFKPEDFGPGYNFLRGLADTVQDFSLTSGASQLTETQQDQLLSALDPQLAQTEGGALSAYGPLARSFVNPFFSAGSLTGKVKNRFGDMIRPPNPAYF